ncbi:MAG: T9SS type A sorting domain-containing protein [Chitinophagaceae bacterium]
MKKFLLILPIVFLSCLTFAQNCARVVSGITVANEDGSYTTTVVYNSDGNKHVYVDFYCNDVLIPGKSFCEDFSCAANCTVTKSYTFSCSGTPLVKFTPYTGNCGGGTQCGPVQIRVPVPGPLPVNLSSFLVGRTGADVSLNWKTEIEMNVVNFEVQRSYDNASFKTIATVAGTVNGASSKSYSYVDNSNTSKSHSFYRLKIVKQGEISYSDIKTVKGLAAKADFVIFPNPSVGNAKITISDLSEPTRIQLLDNSGRLVKTLMLNNTNTVDLNGLQKGAYMVRIIGSVSGNTETRKLTVIK